MNVEIQALTDQFGIADTLQFDNEQNGLIRATVTNSHCCGSVFLHGAHVCSYRPHVADELLFVSQKSSYQNDKPIRGGVPICFPWFGAKQDDEHAPSHGLARVRTWALDDVQHNAESTRLAFHLVVSPFDVRYLIDFGSALSMTLEVANTSSVTETFETALHSYFRLANAQTARITGLEEASFTDQLQASEFAPTGKPIQFAAETDRIYHDSSSVIRLFDEDARRIITIERTGSASVVVWNPWIDKSNRMADFGDDEWPRMCCIETANVRNGAIQIEAGERHIMTAIHRVRLID